MENKSSCTPSPIVWISLKDKPDVVRAEASKTTLNFVVVLCSDAVKNMNSLMNYELSSCPSFLYSYRKSTYFSHNRVYLSNLFSRDKKKNENLILRGILTKNRPSDNFLNVLRK